MGGKAAFDRQDAASREMPHCIALIFGNMKIKMAGQQQDTDRMARKPTDLPSLAAAMVEDATKAFVRDDGAMSSEAVLRHYRAATRAAVAAALRRLARHSPAIFDDGRIHIEQLVAEIEGPSGRATQGAEPCAGNAKEARDPS